MRLHRLEATAFGPFTGTAEVDLDRLGEAGLFLLSGATGAGKTSVLDAICFALYGDVPGDRSGAKRLRSDRAAPTVATRVELETTLGGRRFRFVRSPSWERPKKRGTGTTTAPATVSVSELVEGSWDGLTSRADEAGDLVTRLLGMTLTQFTQVALLPQGRFATFLRARSEERHALLQQLFRTGRFEQVERWLRDRRVELTRTSARHHEDVAGLLSRVCEVTGSGLPPEWDAHELDAPDGPASRDELAPWARRHLHGAEEAREAAAASAAAAAREETDRRGALEVARVAHDRARRLGRARADQARLEADAPAHADAVRRLGTARQAAPVLPLHAELSTLAATADRARASAAAARADLVSSGGGAPTGDLSDVARDTARLIATARGALPRDAERARLREELAGLAAELIELEGARADLDRRRPELLEQRELARLAEVAAREGALLLDARRAEATELTVAVRAAQDASRLRVELDEARGVWLDARSRTLDLRDRLADLQQARIEGMAGELALSLAAGCSCPVCGSHDHPAKAPGGRGAPDAAAEREARRAVADAEVAEAAHDDAVRSLSARLATLDATAGALPVEDLERRLHQVRAALGDLEHQARQHPSLLTRREATEAACAALAQEDQEFAARHAATRTRVEVTRSRVDRLERDLAAVLDGTGEADLDSWLEHLELLAARCEAAAAAERDAEDAARAEGAGRARLDAALARAGFGDAPAALESALAAALDPAALEELAGQVADHERDTAEVGAVLRDLGADRVPAVDETSVADASQRLGQAEAAHTAAADALASARASVETGNRRAARLASLAEELEAACRSWQPVRTELSRTTALASFCEGKSADNALRMRLSAYVLAYRLTQVVDAANERLTTMSDGRYRLEHTADRGVGETRGGLSLLVRDDWSGEARDPATLSGGETFVTSLALALGLADVIAHESGGAALDTLFVDEGFGSLDADTLDDVMDTLDALRDGGRVVGVVSHVAEMRDRIPTQLVVTKSRQGSSVRLAL